MKPLDEHLRDASTAWLQEARPTLAETEEIISRRMDSRTRGGFLLGGLSLVAAAGIGWWLLASAPEAPKSLATRTPVEVTTPTNAPSIRPVSPPAATATQPAATPVVRPSRQDPAVVESGRTDRWIADGTLDGFTAEYERVLSRAMQYERTDPLRAANEYLGLGRLCIAREHFAHAVSALQRAEELIRRGQFTHLTDEVRTRLDEAQQRVNRP